MRVQELMTRDPACCTPDMRIQDVARLMLDNDCGEIPVLDNKDSAHLVGVVTDRDIATRAVAEGLSPTDTLVSEIMSSSVVTVRENSSLDECRKLMERNQVRRLPVVDESGRCCGIVSQADIALQGKDRKTGNLVQDVSRPGGGSSARH